jgi:hypothetical protein
LRVGNIALYPIRNVFIRIAEMVLPDGKPA